MASSQEEAEARPGATPDDCPPEDVRYRSYVLEKVRRGLASAEREGVIEQEEAEARLSRWLQE